MGSPVRDRVRTGALTGGASPSPTTRSSSSGKAGECGPSTARPSRAGPFEAQVNKIRPKGRGKPCPYDDEHYNESGRGEPCLNGRGKPRHDGRGKPLPYIV